MTALNGTKQAGLPQMAPASSVSLKAAIGDVTAIRPASTGGADDEQLAVSFGKMTVDDAATKYVDGVHWTAILEGVSGLLPRSAHVCLEFNLYLLLILYKDL
jgi:hypothetical protein